MRRTGAVYSIVYKFAPKRLLIQRKSRTCPGELPSWRRISCNRRQQPSTFCLFSTVIFSLAFSLEAVLRLLLDTADNRLESRATQLRGVAEYYFSLGDRTSSVKRLPDVLLPTGERKMLLIVHACLERRQVASALLFAEQGSWKRSKE